MNSNVKKKTRRDVGGEMGTTLSRDDLATGNLIPSSSTLPTIHNTTNSNINNNESNSFFDDPSTVLFSDNEASPQHDRHKSCCFLLTSNIQITAGLLLFGLTMWFLLAYSNHSTPMKDFKNFPSEVRIAKKKKKKI